MVHKKEKKKKKFLFFFFIIDPTYICFHYALGVFATLNTRTHVRLLGPCFKTGRLKPFRQPS